MHNVSCETIEDGAWDKEALSPAFTVHNVTQWNASLIFSWHEKIIYMKWKLCSHDARPIFRRVKTATTLLSRGLWLCSCCLWLWLIYTTTKMFTRSQPTVMIVSAHWFGFFMDKVKRLDTPSHSLVSDHHVNQYQIDIAVQEMQKISHISSVQ